MSELAEIASSAMAITIGGKTYRMSPIGPRELGEFELWLQQAPFEKAVRQIETLGNHCDAVTKAAIIASASKESDELTFQSEKAKAYMLSIQGLAYLLWISMRQAHPDMTREEVIDLLTLENMEYFQATLDKVSGLTMPKSLQKKTARGRKRKVREIRR